jgi:hypothetical protein
MYCPATGDYPRGPSWLNSHRLSGTSAAISAWPDDEDEEEEAPSGRPAPSAGHRLQEHAEAGGRESAGGDGDPEPTYGEAISGMGEEPWEREDDQMWGEDELELEAEEGGYLSEGWDTDDYDPSLAGTNPGGLLNPSTKSLNLRIIDLNAYLPFFHQMNAMPTTSLDCPNTLDT